MAILIRPLVLAAALGGFAATAAWAQAASVAAADAGADPSAVEQVTPPPVSTGHRALDRWLDVKLEPGSASTPLPPASAATPASAAPASAAGARGEPPPALLQASPQTIIETQPETLREALQREAAEFAARQRRAQEAVLPPPGDESSGAAGDDDGPPRPDEGAGVAPGLKPVLLTVREHRYTVLGGVLLLAFAVALRSAMRGGRRRSRGRSGRRGRARASHGEHRSGQPASHSAAVPTGLGGGHRRTGTRRRRRL